MDIDAARKLLNKFDGFIRLHSYQYYEEDTGYKGAAYGLDKYFSWWYCEDDSVSIDGDFKLTRSVDGPPFDFEPHHFLDKRWLYYNDKFECLTCEKCCKLLNDMEGLASVCECKVGLRITNAPPSGIQTLDAFDPASYDDTLLRAEEAQKEWHKNTDNILEKHQAFMDGVKLGEKIKPQYPGMIEVNYLSGGYRNRNIIHYSQIKMYSMDDKYYIFDQKAENLIVHQCFSMGGDQVFNIDYHEISKEEYHRILNLFKASGLEVTE